MKFILLLAAVSGLTACASSPDINNDPRSGGLFGGVSGLIRGDYDARAQQRQMSLDRLSQAKALLSQEANTLDQQRNNKEAELNTIRYQVLELDAEVEGLSSKISATKRASKANESKIQEISKKKRELQQEIDRIRASIDNQQIDVKEAEERRDKLHEEYKLLVTLLNNL